MATDTLRPYAAGDETNIEYQIPVSGEHVDKLDEASPDENTYIYTGSGSAKRDLYHLTHPAGIGVINSVTVYARCYGGFVGKLKLSVKTGGVIGESAEKDVDALSWTNYSEAWATNPDTSAAWTWEELVALQAGLSLRSTSAGYSVYCTQLYVVIDYTPGEAQGFSASCRIAFTTDPFSDSPSWADVSSDLIAFNTRRGRQSQLDRFEAGTAIILLDNAAGSYWPSNDVKKRRRVNIRGAFNGYTYDLYTGFIRKFTPVWLAEEGLLHPCMQIECDDLQRSLARAKLNNAGYDSEASGTRVGNVLDDAGWNATERVIDTGKVTLIASGAVADIAAMSHLYAIQESEVGIFWIRGDGYTIFQERGARGLSPYTIPQAIYGDGGLPVHIPVFSDDDDLLFNEVRLTREGGTEQVASDADSIDDYGLSTLTRTGLLFTSDAIAYLYCLYYLAKYKESPFRVKEVTLKPQDTAHESDLWPDVLGLEIGTRITLVRAEAGIDTDYFIEGISHDYDYRRGVWTTKWQLSDAAQYIAPPTAIDEILRPDGNSSVQFTPSAGTNWQCVDEDPASDADYVSETVPPTAPGSTLNDLYTAANLSTTDTVINSITLHVRYKISGAGVGMWLKANVNGNVGSEHGTTGGIWTDFTETWTTNPGTGVAWTPAEINAITIGIRGYFPVGSEIYCSQVYLTVNHTLQW